MSMKLLGKVCSTDQFLLRRLPMHFMLSWLYIYVLGMYIS